MTTQKFLAFVQLENWLSRLFGSLRLLRWLWTRQGHLNEMTIEKGKMRRAVLEKWTFGAESYIWRGQGRWKLIKPTRVWKRSCCCGWELFNNVCRFAQWTWLGTLARQTHWSQKNWKLAPIWETQGPVKDVTLDVMEGVVVCFKLRRDRISISDIWIEER